MKLSTLSLCMIVKDEADWIQRCLTSINHVVDEIIIVDTGSSDDTVDICKSHGAKVFPFTWNGSFSDARNYSLQKAEGDWILWLDADEEVNRKDAKILRDIMYFDDADVYSIHLINYYGTQINEHEVLEIEHPRVFRNHKGYRFINRIHETLNVNSTMLANRIRRVPIKVYHYGYIDAVVEKKQKALRNLSMLKKELNENPSDPWLHYHMASEYYRLKMYPESFEHVNRSIVLFITQGFNPPGLIYKLKYSILISTGSFKGAWPSIEKAILLYPNYVDLHFYKGIILLALKRYQDASDTFSHCIELGDGNISQLTQRGTGSYHAWYYKGVCQEKLGNFAHSVKCYTNALKIYPSYQSAIDALQNIQKK